MEASPILLVALLTLYMMPTSLAAINCYVCNAIPGYEPISCSNEHAESITCDDESLDRCMTLTGTLPGDDDEEEEKEEEDDGHGHDEEGASKSEVIFRNCTSSLACNQGGKHDMCKLPNASAGTISDCKVDCCEGDYCNAVVRISGLVASFVPILMTLFQYLFPEA